MRYSHWFRKQLVMKKTLFLLTLAAFATSCNDNEVTPLKETNEALVTRVSRNGITQLELLYDVDRKLYRMSEYYEGSLLAYTIYEYDEGGLKELRRYIADDLSLDYRIVFTHDNFQRVIKGERYHSANTDQVATILTFEYDGEGLLKIMKLKIYQSLAHQDEYTYDDQGNEVTKVITYNPNQDHQFRAQYDYTPGDETIPDEWKEYAFILDITGPGETLKNMFISKTRYRLWDTSDALVSETSFEVSGQEYSDDGNLIRQKITRKDITDPENPDIIDDMSYDFSQQD